MSTKKEKEKENKKEWMRLTREWEQELPHRNTPTCVQWHPPTDAGPHNTILVGKTDKELFNAAVLRGFAQLTHLRENNPWDLYYHVHFWFPSDAPAETPLACSFVIMREVTSYVEYPVNIVGLLSKRKRGTVPAKPPSAKR